MTPRPLDPARPPRRRTCPFGPALLALSLGTSCGAPDDPDDPDDTGDASTGAPASASSSDTTGEPTTTATTGAPSDCEDTTLTLPAAPPVTRALVVPPGARCTTTLQISDAPRVVELSATAGTLLVGPDERPADEPGWQRPRELATGDHPVHLDNPGDTPLAATLTVTDLGPSPPPSTRERSLAWTQDPLVEPPAHCGLACLMAAISADGHGGPLLRAWFDRFSTTLHSQRFGPKNLLDDFAAAHGDDPTAWDLAALPFIVTAVHNRIDLHNGTHCGEFRVSLASEHPIFRPFHLIFLFAQPPVPGDISPGGALHCAATALKWARLGELPEPAFYAAAEALLAEHVTPDRFLAAESNEFIIAPWEWRQWFFTDPQTLDNRPLFQTVDIPRLSAPGPDRDAFLAWAEANADALTARRLEIPEQFRSPSARANQGVPWVPLVLTPALDAAYPGLRRNLEIVGCPACHATDAVFVQTTPLRTFSPFYDKELDARALYLDALARGQDQAPPYGPLQPDPLLPP